MEVINATGRRKTAIARVYMKEGTGQVTVNKRDVKEYFPTSVLQYTVKQAFEVTQTENTLTQGTDGEEADSLHRRSYPGYASKNKTGQGNLP